MPKNTGCVGGGNLKEQLKIVNVLAPVQLTATNSPNGISRAGYNSVIFSINVTEDSGTGTLTPSIVHGDAADSLAAPAAADLGDSDTPAAISATGIQNIYVDCRDLKEFVGIVLTAASSPTMTTSVVAVKGAATEVLPAA